MADESLHPVPNGAGAGYEHKEADVRIIIWSTIILAIVVAITFVLSVGLFVILQRVTTPKPRMSTMANPSNLPPAPRLQEHPALELNNLRRHEDEILGGYGWVDEKAGVVRIPIDKAMDILAQKGLPAKNGEVNGGK